MTSEKEDASISSYDPRKEPIGQLLSLTNPSLVVPDWQRNYSWKTEHVEVFWNDLQYFMEKEGLNPKGEYFLGSVVIVKTPDGDFKVLDGQQRLATSAILLSVIRDEVKLYKPDAGAQLQSQYLVGYDHVDDKSINKLRLNIYDREYFRQLILTERGGDYRAPKAEIASHKLILNTRRIFEDKIKVALEGLDPKPRFDRAMLISRCLLRHMTVISVYSSNEDSAAEVFETLNDRGIGLSTPDLLRNLVIRRAKEPQLESVVELWKDVISFETDNAIKNFLRHYWVSRYGDVKSQSLYREIKAVIEKDDIASLQFSQNLSASSANYRDVLQANTDDSKLNNILVDARQFGASSAILNPVFLGIYEVLAVDTRATAAGLLLNLFVRHSILMNRENSRLENVIYAAVRKLRDDKSIEDFVAALKEFAPADDEVVSSFERLSISHNGTRRAILKRFELNLRGTEELDVADPSRVHVEHIYPRNPKLGERLENHIRIVDRIGNLTLLSARLNTSIKNGSFTEKKSAFEASELLMTKELAKNVGWSQKLIESRQKKMAKLAPSLWPIDA